MAEKMKLDRIVGEETLFSARDIAASGGELTEKDGRPAARFEGTRARELVLPSPPRDLREFDQFELRLWMPEGASARVGIDVRLSSRTEGLPENDRIWHGPMMPVRFSGWGAVHVPEENLHVYGTPAGWFPVERMALRISIDAPGVFVGDLLAQKRRRAAGPRLTDRGLFSALRLERLPKVRRIVEKTGLKDAKDELLAHFRRRKEPRHFFGRPLEGTSRFSPAAADEICAHHILGQHLPRKIDWRANPIGYLEWRHAFNRHHWTPPLINAYKATGDERYAAEFDYLVSSWMKQNPEPVDTNGGGDPAWETLSTAIRIYGSWLETWFSLQESPSFRPRTRIDMLKSFRAHARHLLQYQGGPNNWIVVESRALAMLGMLFPEFEEAEEWREEGVRRLTRELHRQVYPDGVQYETSPGYHSMSALGFCDVFRLARMNGIALDPLFARRLEGMFDYVMHATRPDGTWPSLNDSGGCRGRRRAGFLDLGAELFKRPDMAWVASSGGRGRRPRRLSRTFEDAGIMVMRTGWTRSDKYLIFDGGPFAAAHQHEDKLSFELCSDGTLFIVDPGISSYMREPWTHYYRSPEAHNTVLVDGRGQDRRNRQSRDEHIRSVRGENVWFIGKAYDCIRAEYGAGFAGLDEKVVHRRSVLFLKPDYWLVWDELLGDSPRGIEALYHFMPMRLQVDGEKGRVRTDRLGKANLEMIALPRPERFDVSVVTGRRDPVQGWISDGEDIPAPVVVLAAREALPFSFGAAFVPYATGNSAGVEVSVLSPSAFRLTFKNGRKDTFFVRGAGEQAATDAEIAVLREDAKGGLVSAFRVGGSFVGRRGERVPIPTSGPAAEFVSPQK